jgi:hypothetical protein
MLTIVNSPVLSERTLLLFLSSGLVGLAQLVRRSLGCPLPKPQRLVVWIGEMPEESQGEDFAHFVGNEELSWTTHEARGPVHRRQERMERAEKSSATRKCNCSNLSPSSVK